jgi:D-beta-D-heptose 7-phosphate kinase/D-beta-D-heptose 1-phosphate adenosyltransferase
MNRTVIVSGGFDPIHSGHIEYFKAAKALGNKLVVAVNSDKWLVRKKGKSFMPFAERANIIKHLDMVDEVIGFNDDDDSANSAIFYILSTHGIGTRLIFANGGDRTIESTAEYNMYKYFTGLDFAWGVGGVAKLNSSSVILKEWSQPTTERAWGTYTVLDKNNNWQVKELSFLTGMALSDQRHIHRSEHWHVVSGQIQMKLEFSNGLTKNNLYTAGDSIDIPKNTWHKATNTGSCTATVIEVWMGDTLMESDIERRD